MKVIKFSDVEPSVPTPGMFTGEVQAKRLVSDKTAQGLHLGIVTFSPGAKNRLHTHTGEQILFVLEGKGIVATEDEEAVVTPGMLVYIPPGEKHWHGATEDTSFSHISIQTPGKTNF